MTDRLDDVEAVLNRLEVSIGLASRPGMSGVTVQRLVSEVGADIMLLRQILGHTSSTDTERHGPAAG